MIAQKSGMLVIARVRLPKHPNGPDTLDEQTELNNLKYEIETMKYIKDRLPQLAIPEVYTYAGPSTKHAEDAGAPYMLIQGFYGDTLHDIEFDMTNLSIENQEHIITQWTAAQVALASLEFPVIGSIRSTLATGDPELGALSSAAIEGLDHAGPFSDALSYFKALGKARYTRACQAEEHSDARFALLTFTDIVENTELFTSKPGDVFSFNHMDMGTHNFLVDDKFNFLAVIDWELAQSAPWQVSHYPRPFSRTWSDEKEETVLRDPGHMAYQNLSRHIAARKLYVEKMKQAEEEMTQQGHPLARSIADSLDGPESRIFALFESIVSGHPNNESFAYEMVRLAYGMDLEAAKQYIDTLENKMDPN